jgi:2-polyprenyl-3-methyl-5-hydroxy-6-metoxy-1,4-benzoquinol methylase
VNINHIKDVLLKVANEYPAELVEIQKMDIPRIAFNINLAINSRDIKKLTICDLGGGIGLFSIGCAALGFKQSVLVDDFRDSINIKLGNSILDHHRDYGVTVVSTDVIKDGFKEINGKFDVITSFDSIEHWHHSPKKLFGEAIKALNPKGTFVLGAPNCVNMRKRITVPFGIGKWSSLDDWYQDDIFRGHVREPDLSDLKYIAEDLNLKNIKVYGRNWLGYYSANIIIRWATMVMDYPLRINPSFCSDIYVVGEI